MKQIAVLGLLVVIFLLGFYVFGQDRFGNERASQADTNSETSDTLVPVENITHGHGLAVDVKDPNKLYIATHQGLFVLIDDKDLYQIGERRDDYMGFSPHPTDSNVFFTSGHPRFGGNLGFQKSSDGGFTWEKISDGIRGPVDFHAMTVSPVNPDLIFGWYQGTIQRSTDGGKNWEIAGNTPFPVVGLAADPKDENTLYATSSQGLFVSKNKAKSFDRLFEGFVSAIAVNPSDSQTLLSFSEKYGMAKSNDAGRTWENINEDFGEETVLYIAINKQKPEIVYALTRHNSVYKSVNGGNTWSAIR